MNDKQLAVNEVGEVDVAEPPEPRELAYVRQQFDELLPRMVPYGGTACIRPPTTHHPRRR
jgi:hypothetical protein